MRKLTDGEREILAEQENDARELAHPEDASDEWDDVYESQDCLEDTLNRLLGLSPAAEDDSETPY
jgi:hypothetical protein